MRTAADAAADDPDNVPVHVPAIDGYTVVGVVLPALVLPHDTAQIAIAITQTRSPASGALMLIEPPLDRTG